VGSEPRREQPQSAPPSHPLRLTAKEKDRIVFENQISPLNLFVSNEMDRQNEKPYIYVYILRPFLFGFDLKVPRLRISFLFCFKKNSH